MSEKCPSNYPTAEAEEPAFISEYRENAGKLLLNLKHNLPELEKMLAHIESDWGMEDGIYRFYHQSFKVYHLQQLTVGICSALQQLLPDRSMNSWFTEIVAQGTGREFELSHNQDWLCHTRPIVEAFLHAHYFLKVAVKYGKELNAAPDHMPSGWASVLYLFNLR